MPWNPQQYERFKSERAAPFEDLLALIEKRAELSPIEVIEVIDLGCGTGQLTAQLASLWPHAQVLGIDASAEMLAQAPVQPRLQFKQQTIESTVAGGNQWDLVFSHAALQWIDDHQQLWPQIWSLVRPGGQLAIQMPSNHGHTTHQLLRKLVSAEPFCSALSGWKRPLPVLGIEAYAHLLYDLGASQIQVLEKVYPHVLESAEELVQWMKGTAMVPYLERLSADLAASLVQAFRAEIQVAFPESPVFYGFRRTLIYAQKESESVK